MRGFRLVLSSGLSVAAILVGPDLPASSAAPRQPVGPRQPAAVEDLPNVAKLPDSLPTSKLPQEGKMQPVRATADNLTKMVTKPCEKCGAKGVLLKQPAGGKRGAPARPVEETCPTCKGNGRVPSDLPKVETGALAVVSAIVRMSPETQGASIALNNAYDALTTHILKDKRNFVYVQAQSAANLSQVKPQVDKMVLVKGLFANELKHPNRPDERVYILRLAHKKQVVAVVGPKQADPPLRGNRALVGGVIAGTVDVDAGSGVERVVVIERGFLIAPNLDNGWWNDE